MADTPTSESKAKAEDAHARTDAGQDRDPRRGARKGKGKGRSSDASGGRNDSASSSSSRSRPPARPRRDDKPRRDNDRDRRSEQPLTAGLFAGVADREMPCRMAGCTNTWTWFGTQQIRSLGKPPPKRMCSDHLATFEGIEDKQMPCRNTWCTNTWPWSRGAQLFQRERGDKLKPPHRLCEQCFEEEKTTEDVHIKCKVADCTNTWTWDRHAQLRHRAWVRRQQAKIDAEEAEDAREDQAAEAEQPRRRSEPVAEDEQPRRRSRSRTEGEKPKGESAVEQAAGEQLDGEQAAGESADESAEVESALEQAAGESADGESALEQAAGESADGESVGEQAAGESAGEQAAGEQADGEQADGEQADREQPTAQVQADGQPSADEQDKPGRKRRRKRRRKRKVHDGPPEKLCQRCFERLAHVEPIEVPCKVHGCADTWLWEREGQLRAWANLEGQANVTELPQPPRRMCNGCFEFVRHHSDREVSCGRPGCASTWTYKTGAQLQDFLAGRTQDPIRLCEECSRSQFTISTADGVVMPEGAEVMPCQVAGCSGSWVYAPGMKLSSTNPDAEEPPVDRMCDDCRGARGVDGRDPRRAKPREPASPSEDAGSAEPLTSEPEPDVEPDVDVEAESPTQQ